MIHVDTFVSVVPAPRTTALDVNDPAVAVTVPDHHTADQLTFSIPDHLVTILKSIFVSHPVALIVGHVPVAAFVIVNSFTALVTGVVGNLMNSLELLS